MQQNNKRRWWRSIDRENLTCRHKNKDEQRMDPNRSIEDQNRPNPDIRRHFCMPFNNVRCIIETGTRRGEAYFIFRSASQNKGTRVLPKKWKARMCFLFPFFGFSLFASDFFCFKFFLFPTFSHYRFSFFFYFTKKKPSNLLAWDLILKILMRETQQ